MITPKASPTRSTTTWQLPWLRLSLILRHMSANAECRDEDIAELLTLRRNLAQRGWFN
jgi:hypothetical protein